MLRTEGAIRLKARKGLKGLEIKNGDYVRIFTTTLDDEFLAEILRSVPRCYEVRIKHERFDVELSLTH